MPTTRVIAVDPDRPDSAAIAEAAQVIRAGGLVAFATETVYGLGADATNPEAVARIFEAKGRPSTNPLIVHVHNKAAALACVVDWPSRADILADLFWPGPLTLVLPRSSAIPDVVTAGQSTVGVRVPRPIVARWLILEAGRPIAAPSANRSNQLSTTEASAVLEDLEGRVDLILDSGRTWFGIESTVLDLTSDSPRVLRPGNVTTEQIAQVLGEPVGNIESHRDFAGPASSPGLMAVHYAPKTPAYRLDRDKIPSDRIKGRFRSLIFGGVAGPWPRCYRQPRDFGQEMNIWQPDPEEAAASFYWRLHVFDSQALDFILIIPPPDEPRWRAIRDRIWRATKPWPFEIRDLQ